MTLTFGLIKNGTTTPQKGLFDQTTPNLNVYLMYSMLMYLVTANGETATQGTLRYCAINHPSQANKLKTTALAPLQALKLPCISMTLSCRSSPVNPLPPLTCI